MQKYVMFITDWIRYKNIFKWGKEERRKIRIRPTNLG